MAVPYCLTLDGHGPNLIDHLQNLRIKELFFDMTLVCNGKYFPAHRCVLSSCSSYFEAILAKVPCQHPFLILSDVEERDLKTLLDFMYQGKVTVFMDQLHSLLHVGKGLAIKGLEKLVYPPTNYISGDSNASIQMQKIELIDTIEFQDHQLSESSFLNHCLDPEQKLDLKIESEFEDDSLCLPPQSITSQESLSTPKEQKMDLKIESEFEDDSLCLPPQSITSQQESFSPPKGSVTDSAELSPKNSDSSKCLNEKNFFCCDFCLYQTKYLGNFYKHLRIHTGEKPYSCSQCPFTFSDPSSLKNHSKAHNEQKPLRCAVCSFSTANQSSLMKHVRIHSPSSQSLNSHSPLVCGQWGSFNRRIRRNRRSAVRPLCEIMTRSGKPITRVPHRS